jgi:heme/copper-type cytochrome/quinol oxidase subunit 2
MKPGLNLNVFVIISFLKCYLFGNLQTVHTNSQSQKSWIEQNYIFIIIVASSWLVISSILFAFCKIALRRGYKCRCGERTKWFIKALFYQIFIVFFILYYMFKAFNKLLDCICPDTKEEDNKLKEIEVTKKERFVEFKNEKI